MYGTFVNDFCGSSTVHDKGFGSAMCNIWAVSVNPLPLRDESDSGEMKEEGGSRGGGGERGV